MGTLLIAACSGPDDYCIVHGQLDGMTGGELYIYTPLGPRDKIDTLTVREGKFTYQLPQPNKGYAIMIFPNLSEQVFFFENNLEVNINGKANNLRSMTIEGGEDNKLMAQFRKETEKASPDQIVAQSAAFIKEHPESMVSVYLLRENIIGAENPNIQTALESAQILQKAQPEIAYVAQIYKELSSLSQTQKGMKAPDFSIKDDLGVEHKLSDYKDQNLLLVFGALSYEGFRDELRILRDDIKMNRDKAPAELNIILDMSRPMYRTLKYDSIPGTNIPEIRSFFAPIAKSYHITQYPTYILIDKNQKIVARSNQWNKIKAQLGI